MSMKIDVGLGKAAMINSIGNMAAQGMQNSHERDMVEEQEKNQKISAIQNFEFSTDSTEFMKQFIGMCEDYKASFSLGSKTSDAYYNRMDKAMKVLMATDTELYNKAKPFFDEITAFLAEKKEKDKKNNYNRSYCIFWFYGSNCDWLFNCTLGGCNVTNKEQNL